MNGAEGKRWILWMRVSGSDQHASNQEPVMRTWAEQLGGTVARVYVVEDSASQEGRNRGKGRDFEAQRADMIGRLRNKEADGILIWSLDRLTRLGPLDMLLCLQALIEHAGADVRSHEEPWLNTVDPFARAILVPFFATIAQFETKRRSERSKLGMARVKQEIAAEIAAGKTPSKKIGGRKPGSRNRRRYASSESISAAWQPGGPLHEAQQRRKAALLADPVRLRESGRDVPCPPAPEGCGAGVGDVCRVVSGPNAGRPLKQAGGHLVRRKAHQTLVAGAEAG